MFSRILKSLAVTSTLLANSVYASPISLESNTNYSLTGNGIGVDNQLADNGVFFLAFYQNHHANPTAQAGDFHVYFDVNGEMSTGNISGSSLSTLNVEAVSNLLRVVEYDGTSWNEVSGASGSATSSMNYQNLTLNSNDDIFSTIHNIGTGTGSVDTTISFGGNSVQLNRLITASFMPFDQTAQDYYDPTINAFSNNGILDFALAGFNGGIHGWFEASNTVQFGGTTYYLQGDIHGNYASEVPEPASMGLLGAGLFGIIARRKKKVLA